MYTVVPEYTCTCTYIHANAQGTQWPLQIAGDSSLHHVLFSIYGFQMILLSEDIVLNINREREGVRYRDEARQTPAGGVLRSIDFGDDSCDAPGLTILGVIDSLSASTVSDY